MNKETIIMEKEEKKQLSDHIHKEPPKDMEPVEVEAFDWVGTAVSDGMDKGTRLATWLLPRLQGAIVGALLVKYGGTLWNTLF